MFHQEILEKIRKERQRKDFLYPAYGLYSIAEFAPSISWMFNVRTERAPWAQEILDELGHPERVVVLLLDGFGYHQMAKYHKQYDFFRLMEHNSRIFPITSVFPSTTPAALTTIHTGLTPQEHGLPEMTVFFAEMDAVIETLPFKLPLRDKKRDSLIEMGGTVEMLYDGPTIYEQLAQAKIPSHVFYFYEYANSVYQQATQKGARTIPYANGLDLMEKLRTELEGNPGPGYFFVYWASIDQIAHQFGPYSPEHENAIKSFSDVTLYDFILKLKKSAAKNTKLLILADHGHANVTREKIIYLNNYLELENNYLQNKRKQNIVPTGSPHDVFLFINKSKIQATLELLNRELKGKAEIISVKEALGRGLFGLNEPSQKFLNRVGDILILPFKGREIWYEYLPHSPFTQLGCHGGLTEDEMLVPLVIADLDKVIDAAKAK